MTDDSLPTQDDYEERIEFLSDVVIEEMTIWELEEITEEIDQSLQYSHEDWLRKPSLQLLTILYSDQDPDFPDHNSAWYEYADLTESRPAWTDHTRQMAYVCMYSDIWSNVLEKLEEHHNDDDPE